MVGEGAAVEFPGELLNGGRPVASSLKSSQMYRRAAAAVGAKRDFCRSLLRTGPAHRQVGKVIDGGRDMGRSVRTVDRSV